MLSLWLNLVFILLNCADVSGLRRQIHDLSTELPTSTGSSPTIDNTLLAGSCNFEKDVCGYTNDNIWPLRWERSNGAYIRGIEYDHTSGSGTGNFLYLNTNVLEAPSSINTGIDTPELNYDGKVCILFYYMMAGPSEINILVFDTVIGAFEKVLVVFDEATDIWTQVNVTAQVTINSTIKFQSQKTGFFNYVAIDDVQVTAGNCSGKGDQPIVKQCVITPKIAQNTFMPSPTTTEVITTNTSQSPAKTVAMLSSVDEASEETEFEETEFRSIQDNGLSYTFSYSILIIAAVACAVFGTVVVIVSVFAWRTSTGRRDPKQILDSRA